MNNVSLTGRLGKDPELTEAGQTGKNVCKFSIAVDRGAKNAKDEWITDWINCVAWEKSAEHLCKYAEKGSLIGVQGRIETRSWQADNGDKRFATDIVCSKVEVLDKRKKSQEDGTGDPTNEMTPIDDADLPF